MNQKIFEQKLCEMEDLVTSSSFILKILAGFCEYNEDFGQQEILKYVCEKQLALLDRINNLEINSYNFFE